MKKLIFIIVSCLLLGAGAWLGFMFLKPILVTEATPEYSIPKELQELPEGENLFIAGVREGSYSFIGDELTLLLVLSYDSESIKINKEKLTVIDLAPFEIRSTRNFEESFQDGRKVFIKEYKIQCLTCVPGKGYSLPKIPVEFSDSTGHKFSQEVEIQEELGNPMNILFFSDPQSGFIPPLKGPTEVSDNILGFVLLGAGIFLGGTAMVIILAKALRFGKKRVQKDISLLDELSQRVSEIGQSFIRNETNDLREILDECYGLFLKLVYLKEGLDLLKDLPPEAIADMTSVILESCEKSYAREEPTEEPTKDDLFLVLYNLEELISYYKSKDQTHRSSRWKFWERRGG